MKSDGDIIVRITANEIFMSQLAIHWSKPMNGRLHEKKMAFVRPKMSALMLTKCNKNIWSKSHARK